MDPRLYHHNIVNPAKKAPVKPYILGADPTQDVHELFSQLDSKFFQDKMKKNGVLLEWSEKASATAGYCYQLNDDVKGIKRCYIVLNKPLLKLRSRNDVVETLLHEMIHALLYTAGIKENHGPNFRRIMRNINKVAGTNITVYHEFRDEVGHCKDLDDLGKPKEKKAKDLHKVGAPLRYGVGAPLHSCVAPPSVRAQPRCAAAPHVSVAAVPRVSRAVEPRAVVGHAPTPLFPGRMPLYEAKHDHKIGPANPAKPLLRRDSRKNLMREILDLHKGAIPDRHIKLLGYEDSEPDFDSDSSDSDFDTDFEDKLAKKKKDIDDFARKERIRRHMELFNIKDDLKDWMTSTVYSYRR